MFVPCAVPYPIYSAIEPKKRWPLGSTFWEATYCNKSTWRIPDRNFLLFPKISNTTCSIWKMSFSFCCLFCQNSFSKPLPHKVRLHHLSLHPSPARQEQHCQLAEVFCFAYLSHVYNMAVTFPGITIEQLPEEAEDIYSRVTSSCINIQQTHPSILLTWLYYTYINTTLGKEGGISCLLWCCELMEEGGYK